MADGIYNNLRNASDRLGTLVREPLWIEVTNSANTKEFEAQLDKILKEKFKTSRPLIIMMLVPRENQYKDFKSVCYARNIPSQVISYNLARRFNLIIGSNLLRQMNSKMQGDLFNVKFAQEVTKQHTMLLGIDVSHGGNKSIVGFCATYNRELTQYYSQRIVQNKG